MRFLATVRILGAALLVSALAGGALAQESRLVIGGTTYTKWLWGNQQYDGSVYNFTTVPGEGFGDNGQGTEIELLLSARLSRAVQVSGRIHSRFNQNQWTNFGGFGGRGPGVVDTNGDGVPDRVDPGQCIGGDCGENDPRSNQYIKMRGMTVVLTPGYRWMDALTIGANDFGQFDPFVIGRIRYIDRDNASGVLLQGTALERRISYDFARISLPRLWAGPGFNTGEYTATDAAYGLQASFSPTPGLTVAGILENVNDIEVNPDDTNLDNGRGVRNRFRNQVYGARVGLNPIPMADLTAAWYYSFSEVSNRFAPGNNRFGIPGFSAVPGGHMEDATWKAALDLNDPLGVGLNLSVEGFQIGSDYVSMMAARRESDVLLTEGFDATWAMPGPSNAGFGVFGGNPTRIGYGGWNGNAMQVATINVDNEFTDFDEPLAESAIGWEGITIAPSYTIADVELGGEYTHIGYDTNWQAWGNPRRSIEDTPYPSNELDTGVLHNFRSAYAPFRDRKTDIGVVRARWVLPVGKGIDLTGKFKIISDTDKRMNETRFLPYNPDGSTRYYFRSATDSFTTAVRFTNPPIDTINGVAGPRWKPFTSISDDDRDLDYMAVALGAGYQLTSDFYGSVSYALYTADIIDGNTAFQAYNLHEMVSGDHVKNQIALRARYILSGTEIGAEWQYNFGTFEPDFGTGFLVQRATPEIAAAHNVKVGSRGFTGRFGGWNSLEDRDFIQRRLKAFLKVQF